MDTVKIDVLAKHAGTLPTGGTDREKEKGDSERGVRGMVLIILRLGLKKEGSWFLIA